MVPAFIEPVIRDKIQAGLLKLVESGRYAMMERPARFHIKIKIGLNLVDALASRYVDPVTGDVAIIGNGNVGTTGEEALIKGTLQFMAPEVMPDQAPPRTESDLYSLALIIFKLFCHGHPMERPRCRRALTQ